MTLMGVNAKRSAGHELDTATATAINEGLSNEQVCVDVNIAGGTVTATIDESTLAKESGGNLDAIKGAVQGMIKTQEQSPISGFATSAKQGQLANNVTSIINNATFNATITSSDIDFSKYANFVVSYQLGTATSSPTMTIGFRYKGIDGTYHSDPDYPDVALNSTNASSSSYAFKGFLEAYDTVQIVATYGGTGSFANCYLSFCGKA